MKLLILRWIFSIFFYVYENTVKKKLRDNRATDISITQKILVCNMEYCDKNISKIRSV